MHETTKFVAACCCWPQDQTTQSRVSQAAALIRDWDDVQQAVTRHRVIPVVHSAVKDLDIVPDRFREWAKQNAQTGARNALKMAHDCIAIDAALKDANLEPLHFKGPTLAQIAYDSVAMKTCYDLDIFIRAADVSAAVAVLETRGYRVKGQTEPVSARQLNALMRNFKDIAFLGPTGTVIELHWTFAHNKHYLVGLENDLQWQTVPVANKASLRTFDSRQMLTYLSLHGATHHWKRLKWLADLSAFLQQLPAGERAQVIADVSNSPASDALAQALKLCDTLFGTRHAPVLSPRAQALYTYALARIDQPYISAKFFRGDVGFVHDVIAMRHLYRTPWAAIWALKCHFLCKEDALALPLPRALNGIYPIIRLPSLLLRRFQGRSA